MNSTSLYLTSLLVTLIYTTIIFFIAQAKKDNSIMDRAYGIGFVITAIVLACIQLTYHGPLPNFGTIIFLLVLIWGTRLSLRIHKKNKNRGEDSRYKELREQWSVYGESYVKIRSFVQIFVLQGFIISLVLLPFTLTISSDLQNAGGLTRGLIAGITLWVIGFLFEAIGDYQLDRFLKRRNDHTGQIMKQGLWKYTRHPNYFGESLMWIGISFIAFAATMSLFVFISPFLITGLLLFVSGIPVLEKRREGNREWDDYAAKTSAFFPLPPKK